MPATGCRSIASASSSSASCDRSSRADGSSSRPPDSAGPRLGSVLEPDVDARYALSDHLWRYLAGLQGEAPRAGNGFGYGLVGPDDVTRTLSARYHKDGSEILIRTDGPTRGGSRQECARLMGFPTTSRLPVSDTQAYRQFGNAVVVPVIQFLGEEIVRQAGLGAALRGGELSGPQSRLQAPVRRRGRSRRSHQHELHADTLRRQLGFRRSGLRSLSGRGLPVG